LGGELVTLTSLLVLPTNHQTWLDTSTYLKENKHLKIFRIRCSQEATVDMLPSPSNSDREQSVASGDTMYPALINFYKRRLGCTGIAEAF
jgi:hypothetical protein